MNLLLGILIALPIVAASASEASAKDSKPAPPPQAPAAQKSTQNDLAASTGLGFVPDGLARNVMNIMTGLSRPIDGSTNVTIQAGTGLRIGLTF